MEDSMQLDMNGHVIVNRHGSETSTAVCKMRL